MKNATHKLWTFQDANREWRWNIKARNGKIVAEGAEGYKRVGTMQRSLANIVKAITAGTLACLCMLSGCSTRTLIMEGTSYKSTSFLNKQTVGVIEYRAGTNSLRVEAWANDQISGAAAIAREAVKGAVQGMKP